MRRRGRRLVGRGGGPARAGSLFASSLSLVRWRWWWWRAVGDCWRVGPRVLRSSAASESRVELSTRLCERRVGRWRARWTRAMASSYSRRGDVVGSTRASGSGKRERCWGGSEVGTAERSEMARSGTKGSRFLVYSRCGLSSVGMFAFGVNKALGASDGRR